MIEKNRFLLVEVYLPGWFHLSFGWHWLTWTAILLYHNVLELFYMSF